MTMIRYFSRQAIRIRSGNGGQATVLFLVVAGTLLTLVLASITLNNVAVARVSCANAADAVALNAATWEARSLNMIAALNDGVTQCMRVIRYTCVVWAALAVAAAFGVGVPAFLEYSRYARELIRNCWKTAHQLVAWSIKIRDAAPYLILGETAALAKKRNVAGVLFPVNPRGAHDGRNTLELHLEPGPPVHLVDAIAPVSSVLNRLRKIRFAHSAVKSVTSLLDAALGFIFQDSKGPIRMLVPEKDFTERQYVRFAGTMNAPVLPIPFLGETRKDPVFAEATAEPYGGGSAEMTWRSRLSERETR
ncbi:MAG: hypothetical protein AB1346_06945 [Thermodesulfobacteriota bacterium]